MHIVIFIGGDVMHPEVSTSFFLFGDFAMIDLIMLYVSCLTPYLRIGFMVVIWL
jgi:hypothetical protein